MKTPGIQWFKYASPQNFYFLAGKLWPWFAGLAAVLTLVGLWIADTGLFDVFPDQAVPMVFVGMILRIIGAKLRGVAARNTA